MKFRILVPKHFQTKTIMQIAKAFSAHTSPPTILLRPIPFIYFSSFDWVSVSTTTTVKGTKREKKTEEVKSDTARI